MQSAHAAAFFYSRRPATNRTSRYLSQFVANFAIVGYLYFQAVLSRRYPCLSVPNPYLSVYIL